MKHYYNDIKMTEFLDRVGHTRIAREWYRSIRKLERWYTPNHELIERFHADRFKSA